MDDDNFDEASRLAKTPEQQRKIHKILNFADPNVDAIVPDPYYYGRFELVFNLLDAACEKIVEKLKP
jgi:protein-tyrosine phosphatase